MRSLDIHEDPTFIPEVAAEATEDKSEAKSTSDIIEQLIDGRSVCDVRVEWKNTCVGTIIY